MNEEEDIITVGELIEKLKQFDQDLPVETDGCDCIGNAVDAKYYNGSVVIVRSNGCFERWVG